MILSKNFFHSDTNSIARGLLGTFLVYESEEGVTVGKIVETESYLHDDPASHAYKGETPRTRAMFGDPGRAYIYFIYGSYYCFNVTTGAKGVGEAVLIRALEPIEGIELMEKRRSILKEASRDKNLLQIPKKHKLTDLCNGPAKLVISMGIKPNMYAHDLTQKPLYILSSDHFGKQAPFEIITTTRVGITKASDLPLRFYIKESNFISKK